jgi:hypothetical protein
MKIIIIIAACISLTLSSKAQVNKNDSLALVNLYNATGGSNWLNKTNWLSLQPVKTWNGITLDDSSKRVIVIYLVSNNLKGKIPVALGNLAALNYLDMSYNQLSGSIPSQLGSLTNLHTLKVQHNKLSDTIPRQLGSLYNLYVLDLSYNKLTGSIPPEIGNLRLTPDLDHNFDGAYLDLSNNQLSGSIPAELGNININSYYDDVYLNLSNNQLSGSIPPQLGSFNFWGNYGSCYVDLSNNRLSGNIPAELGNITLFTWYGAASLNLSNNQLSGNIPAELGNITLNASSLGDVILNLSNNQLSGKIPAELANLIVNDNNLAPIFLNLSHNHLSGPVPSSLASASVDSLNLSYNQFKFDGMELIAQQVPLAKYNQQKIIPVHLNNNSLSVSAGGTLSNNTYRWHKVGQPDVYKFIGNSVFRPSESGDYYVNVRNKIATDLILFSDTVTYTAPNLTNAISVNDALKNNQFSVYPNPARDILYVRTQGDASFSLLDQSGKILLTTNINKAGKIEVSKFSAGEYYLKNNNANEIIKVLILK